MEIQKFEFQKLVLKEFNQQIRLTISKVIYEITDNMSRTKALLISVERE